METRQRELGLNDYLRIFTSRKLLIVIPTIAFLILATAAAYVLPPRYQTKTLFLLKDRGYLTEIYGRAIASVPFEARLGTIQEDIKAYSSVLAVLRDLNLDTDVASDAGKDELVSKYRDELEITLTTAKVGDQQIELAFQHKDPVVAYKFVNAIRDEYTKKQQNKFKDQFKIYLDRLGAQIKESEAELKRQTQLLADFEKNKPDLNANSGELRSKIQRNEKTLQGFDDEIAALQKTLEESQQQLEHTEKVIETKREAENPRKAEAFAQLAKLRQEIADLEKSFDDRYAPLKKKKEELEKQQLEFAKIPDKLSSPVVQTPNPAYDVLLKTIGESQAALRVKEQMRADLDKDLQFDRTLLASLPGLMKQHDDLRLTRDKVMSSLVTLQGDRDHAEIAWEAVKDVSGDLYETLEAARLPRAPVFPNKILFMAIGLGLGAGVGLGLALLLEISRQTFGSVEEAKSALKVPVMGAINIIRSEMDVARVRRRRAMAAMIVLVVLLSSLAFAVVYVEFPDYLPDFVRDHMSSLRDHLR
jgi:capsular polysaccharide biosynthesis protein